MPSPKRWMLSARVSAVWRSAYTTPPMRAASARLRPATLRIDGFYFDPGATMGPVPPRGAGLRRSRRHCRPGLPVPCADRCGGLSAAHCQATSRSAACWWGFNSDGPVAYDENDVQFPIVRDVLSLGAGVSYSQNQNFYSSKESNEWTAGWIARWQPSASLEVTPFWGMVSHKEYRRGRDLLHR